MDPREELLQGLRDLCALIDNSGDEVLKHVYIVLSVLLKLLESNGDEIFDLTHWIMIYFFSQAAIRNLGEVPVADVSPEDMERMLRNIKERIERESRGINGDFRNN